MRALLLSLLLTAPLRAEPPEFVPSYSFQAPHPPVHRVQARAAYRAPVYNSQSAGQPSATRTFGPLAPRPQAQAPVPAHLSNWGGTVVQSEVPGLINITSNGAIPAGSVVGIGHGDHFLGEARVTTSGSNSAQLSTNTDMALSPGDWVNVISIPAPKPAQAFGGYATRRYTAYHPTSTNADPTYQRWLHQGFTLGGVHRGRIYSSGGFSRSYYR